MVRRIAEISVARRVSRNLEVSTSVSKFCFVFFLGFCSVLDVQGDKYLVIHDFPSFIDAQTKVDATYADKAKWCKLSIQAQGQAFSSESSPF